MLCFENDDIKQSNTFTFNILEKVAMLEASYFLIAGTQHIATNDIWRHIFYGDSYYQIIKQLRIIYICLCLK